MILKLLSTQITTYWEVIKFAVTTVDEVDEKDLQPYLVDLLHSLLSNKAQCWMRMGEDRKIIALLITRIIVNKVTENKSLYLQSVFSYREVHLSVWQRDFDLLLKFAKQENCGKIRLDSRHPKIWEIVKSFGCEEIHRSFVYNIG